MGWPWTVGDPGWFSPQTGCYLILEYAEALFIQTQPVQTGIWEQPGV